jgi:LmbE family N-acetylglucosaminyl deacetylase
VTYDHSGVTGHPDHVSLSVEILKMVRGSGRKLLWSTIKPVWPYDHFIHKDVFDMLASPDFELDLGLRWIKKWVAARSHRSQHLGKSLSVPLVFFFMLFHKEWYHEVDLKREYKHKYVEFKI